MPSLTSGLRGVCAKAMQWLTHPGFLTFRFTGAPREVPDPEYFGLNADLVAQRLASERVRVFAARSYEGALTAPLGALLLAWIGGSAAGWLRAMPWLVVFVAVELLIARTGYRYSRQAEDAPGLERRTGRLIGLNFLAGLVWGSSVWAFWTEGLFELYLLNLVILVGVSALSLLIMSSYLGAIVSFFGGLILVPAAHAMTLTHPMAWKLAVALVILYGLLLQFGSAVGQHLVGDIESKVRSRLLVERLRLALGAAKLDWFDLNTRSGDMASSHRHTGVPVVRGSGTQSAYEQWLARIHPDDRGAVGLTFDEAFAHGREAAVEYRLRSDENRWIWVRSTGHVVDRDPSGSALRVIGIHADISEAKAGEETIRRLAYFDQLTVLPNRRLMNDRIDHALATARRQRSGGALMMIDMDDFKTLNDTLGHDVGDQFLREVARRLQSCVRTSDSVGRLGGDEYVVLLEGLADGPQPLMQAEAVAEKILQQIRDPYPLRLESVAGSPQIYSYHCTASIGVCNFSADAVTVDDLYKRADTAMYEAKAAGGNAVRFFDPAMQAEVSARAALANELRAAIAKGEFVLYYQPQVDGHGRVVGSEALLRWLHPTRGVVTPDAFIEVAEARGIIQPIGRWVIESACAQLVQWSTLPETAHLTVSVNVSAAQFRDKSFGEHVLSVLNTSGASPGKLKFEITESLAMTNVEAVIETMSVLRSHGVGWSLDDFGTGHSSLAYLKRLPIEQLKIDRSFVRDALTDPNDAVIAKTIVALANAMGLTVVAEGVETEPQHRLLAGMGCHGFQGYHFGRPMPIERFNATLRAPDPCVGGQAYKDDDRAVATCTIDGSTTVRDVA